MLRKGRHDAPVVPDECDAKGPLVKPALEELTLPWAKWPGLWGSTKAGSPLESNSPRGPVEHSQYTDPLTKHEQAKDCQVAARDALRMAAVPTPDPPELKARNRDGVAEVEWKVGADAATLVLSLDSPDDELPPATYRVERPAPEGKETLPPELELAHSYFVIGRAVNEDGFASDPAEAPVKGT
jgi:hypothetical protein